MIAPRSDRTFYEALELARLVPPTSRQEIGQRFLELLVAGIDHELVGSDTWYRRILEAAPAGAKRSRKS
jgi:hypothetical protein